MIKEIIIVEGRDDTAAINRAVEAKTIETHGFGISKKTWQLIEKAYETKGIIIFTDPDHAGEEIRRKVALKFPKARHAYIDRGKATAKDDIGVENAKPCDIIEALKKVHITYESIHDEISRMDLVNLGLDGVAESRRNRDKVGEILGIGTGGAKAFCKKLNSFGITKDELMSAVKKI